jgi:hypothetical protein
MLGCADEDSAYLSKRMLRVGTSDDARVSTVVNTPKGRDNRLRSPGRHPLDGPVLIKVHPRRPDRQLCRSHSAGSESPAGVFPTPSFLSM